MIASVRTYALAASIVGAALLFQPTVATAHQFYSGGYYSRTMGIATVGVNSSWSPYISPSMTAWNDAGVAAKISGGGAYANYMSTADLSSGILGIYEPITSNSNRAHRTTRFRIRLNTDYNSQDGLTKRWTIVHELGHALGVGHEEIAASVMRSFESTYYYPTVDDKLAVIAAWR